MDLTPKRILLIGDLHGAWMYVKGYLLPYIDKVRPDLLLQLGDFEYWPRLHWYDGYIESWERELAKRGLPLWWIDGNHEDHETLLALPIDPATGRRPIAEHIQHLPRGHRWAWGGTEWLACGGATSVNRAWLDAGVNWFEQEAITDQDVAACVEGGPADVVVAHDIPLGVPYWRKKLQQDKPAWRRDIDWPTGDLIRSDDNQRQLRKVLDTTQPRVWFHGHHHERVNAELQGTSIIGLSRDGWSPEAVTILIDHRGRELVS